MGFGRIAILFMVPVIWQIPPIDYDLFMPTYLILDKSYYLAAYQF